LLRMVDSAAERARRARRHKKGDHSLCDPERRCEAMAAAAARDAAARPVSTDDCWYGPRGKQLRDALADAELGPAHKVLVDEAARMADRLDRLDSALNDKGTWLRFETADGGEIVVTVDNVLAEARQQATALKGIVAELRAAMPRAEKSKPAAKAGGLGDLSARIAARRNASTG
jgi:hypothetical protein